MKSLDIAASLLIGLTCAVGAFAGQGSYTPAPVAVCEPKRLHSASSGGIENVLVCEDASGNRVVIHLNLLEKV